MNSIQYEEEIGLKISEYVNKGYFHLNHFFDHEISGIFENSKEVIPNGIFVAIKGYQSSGIHFIDDAIYHGAKTIICDEDCNIKEIDGINFIFVKSSKVELARLLKWFYQDYKKPIMIGITGTNGKTTVSNIVYDFLVKKGKKAIYIGTSKIKAFYEVETIESTNNTTPCICKIYEKLFEREYEYCVMEVSSQGIMEDRVIGIHFDIVCFTNITQDHLDYHKTMDNYANAKARLAIGLDENAVLILNEDMAYFHLLREISLAKLLTYSVNSFSNNASVLGRLVDRGIDQMKMAIWENKTCFEISSKLIGDFNLENLLASYLIIQSLHFARKEIVQFYPTFSPVLGRMNVFKLNNGNKEIYVVIDFAHTPEGVRQVVEYFLKIKTNHLITIMGCGGNRDHEKRPIMGNIVTKLTDFTYFTEDNSRSEKVENIINDICKGAYSKNYTIIYKRKEAIDLAIKNSEDKDIILLLGKGSEEYIITNTKQSFSDIAYIEKMGGIRC